MCMARSSKRLTGAEAAAATAVADEARAEAALREEEAVEGAELAGGASSGSEDEEEEDVAATDELPALEPVALMTAADAEQLLDAVANHAARPTSMWGCCGGVGNGRHYYCDTCNLYFHEACQKNQSKGRQAPLCPPCHERALEGAGGRTRRRVG